MKKAGISTNNSKYHLGVFCQAASLGVQACVSIHPVSSQRMLNKVLTYIQKSKTKICVNHHYTKTKDIKKGG